jgi:hypothetical protein
VNWEFTWVPTAKKVKTTAAVTKVIKDNSITQKWHMVDPNAIK